MIWTTCWRKREQGMEPSHMCKLIAAVVASILLCAIQPNTAGAQPTARNVFFDPSQSSISGVGDTTVVALSIDDPSQLGAYDFTIQYDSTKVQATAANVQSPFAGCISACTTPGPTPPVGQVICSMACQTPVVPPLPTNIVNVTFQGQAEGNSPLHVTNCDLEML